MSLESILLLALVLAKRNRLAIKRVHPHNRLGRYQIPSLEVECQI